MRAVLQRQYLRVQQGGVREGVQLIGLRARVRRCQRPMQVGLQ